MQGFSNVYWHRAWIALDTVRQSFCLICYNSIVVVYGTTEGSYTYTSVADYSITLPKINAKYIDVVG